VRGVVARQVTAVKREQADAALMNREEATPAAGGTSGATATAAAMLLLRIDYMLRLRVC
jgi:hypothetical protein